MNDMISSYDYFDDDFNKHVILQVSRFKLPLNAQGPEFQERVITIHNLINPNLTSEKDHNASLSSL